MQNPVSEDVSGGPASLSGSFKQTFSAMTSSAAKMTDAQRMDAMTSNTSYVSSGYLSYVVRVSKTLENLHQLPNTNMSSR